MKNIH